MKQENLKITTRCPNCQEFVDVYTKVTIDDNAQVIPKVRSGLTPISTIRVYKITTDDMRKFIVSKVHAITPETGVDVMPRFSQKKQKKGSTRCYASLRIGLSEEAIDRHGDEGWYTKAAESDTNIRFVSTLYKDIIKKYQYDYEQVRKWLNSYDDLEKLENQLGITQEFLNDIKKFCRPQRIVTSSEEQWIMFAAAPENVIYDMLTDVNTNNLIGGIQIVNVNQLSKDLVEYTVYVHPQQLSSGIDPKIRQILLGEEKPKKA